MHRGKVLPTKGSFHGGDIQDEVAALLSPALGVRCRSGGVVRRWWRDNDGETDDPLGRPIEFDHSPPMWVPPKRGRTVLPCLRTSVNLDEAEPLLAAVPRMPGKKAVALIRAARLYGNAVWVADSDPKPRMAPTGRSC